jgi:hypothetical protein
MPLPSGARVGLYEITGPLFGGLVGFFEGNRSAFAVFDKGRRFLVSVLMPVTGPQVITVGQHWIAAIGAKR